MRLKGHEFIINEVLTKFNLFEKLSESSKSGELLKESFLNGLRYPDFPCGELIIKNNNIIDNTTECGLGSLVEQSVLYRVGQMMNADKPENVGTLIAQSHNGEYSYYHAMTPDKNLKNYQVKALILVKCIKLYYLAITKNDLKYLGRLVHIVQDSYSPSHTLRNKIQKNNSFKPNCATDFVDYSNSDIKAMINSENKNIISMMKKVKILNKFY